MNVPDPIDSSTFPNMNFLDSVNSSTSPNINVLVSIDSNTFQNMNVLDFIYTHSISQGNTWMLTSHPVLTSTFPILFVLLSEHTCITEFWSRGPSVCWCMNFNSAYSFGGCQASEEPSCLLRQGIYINHEAKTAVSSRMQKLCETVHCLIQATSLQPQNL